jgi:hypothetical protein
MMNNEGTGPGQGSQQMNNLCTGAFLYVPYSFLLISNKFCNGGEQCGYVTLKGWYGP